MMFIINVKIILYIYIYYYLEVNIINIFNS